MNCPAPNATPWSTSFGNGSLGGNGLATRNEPLQATQVMIGIPGPGGLNQVTEGGIQGFRLPDQVCSGGIFPCLYRNQHAATDSGRLRQRALD